MKSIPKELIQYKNNAHELGKVWSDSDRDAIAIANQASEINANFSPRFNNNDKSVHFVKCLVFLKSQAACFPHVTSFASYSPIDIITFIVLIEKPSSRKLIYNWLNHIASLPLN
jgi:hypothetical protein